MVDISGFIFGKIGGKYFTKKENIDGHILIVGGSGSGKTSCIAIPSLMAWKARVFCIDIKGELYKNTASVRGKSKNFSPLQANSFGYNPFYFLTKTDNPAQETEAISMVLVPLAPNMQDPFWVQSAQNMLTGILLHFYSLGKSFLNAITRILSENIETLLAEIYNTATIPEVRLYLNTFRSMDDKILSTVYSELCRHLMVFATDRHIKNCLERKNSITPDDLENGVDIYINIPEHLLRQWKSLLTLIVSQFLRHFEQRADMNAEPILFLLDEFPRLGKIDGITDAFATLRSKKITVCTIIQSLAQLDMIYGEHARRVIVDNCDYTAVLNATDADSQEYFSKLLGTHEKTKISTNKSYAPITRFPTGTGRYIATEEKRKVKPEDLALLDKIILFTPFGFFKVEKTPYYSRSDRK